MKREAGVALGIGALALVLGLVGSSAGQTQVRGQPKLRPQEIKGCKNYYVDVDRDGYGTLQPPPKWLLTPPSPPYDAPKSGDCNDFVFAINPGRPEVCNGIDDNCSGTIDEGPIDVLCPLTAHLASRTCTGSIGCKTSCSPGFVDMDQSYSNGCELAQDALDVAGSGNACGAVPSSVDGGTLQEWSSWAKDGSDLYVARGNIAPVGDSDWYRVVLTDEVAPTPEARYDFGSRVDGQVRLNVVLDVTDGTFRYDVYQGDCSNRVKTGIFLNSGPPLVSNLSGSCDDRYYAPADVRGPPGPYWIRVYSTTAGTPRNYQLSIRAVPSPGLGGVLPSTSMVNVPSDMGTFPTSAGVFNVNPCFVCVWDLPGPRSDPTRPYAQARCKQPDNVPPTSILRCRDKCLGTPWWPCG